MANLDSSTEKSASQWMGRLSAKGEQIRSLIESIHRKSTGTIKGPFLVSYNGEPIGLRLPSKFSSPEQGELLDLLKEEAFVIRDETRSKGRYNWADLEYNSATWPRTPIELSVKAGMTIHKVAYYEENFSGEIVRIEIRDLESKKVESELSLNEIARRIKSSNDYHSRTRDTMLALDGHIIDLKAPLRSGLGPYELLLQSLLPNYRSIKVTQHIAGKAINFLGFTAYLAAWHGYRAEVQFSPQGEPLYARTYCKVVRDKSGSPKVLAYGNLKNSANNTKTVGSFFSSLSTLELLRELDAVDRGNAFTEKVKVHFGSGELEVRWSDKCHVHLEWLVRENLKRLESFEVEFPQVAGTHVEFLGFECTWANLRVYSAARVIGTYKSEKSPIKTRWLICTDEFPELEGKVLWSKDKISGELLTDLSVTELLDFVSRYPENRKNARPPAVIRIENSKYRINDPVGGIHILNLIGTKLSEYKDEIEFTATLNDAGELNFADKTWFRSNPYRLQEVKVTIVNQSAISVVPTTVIESTVQSEREVNAKRDFIYETLQRQRHLRRNFFETVDRMKAKMPAVEVHDAHNKHKERGVIGDQLPFTWASLTPLDLLRLSFPRLTKPEHWDKIAPRYEEFLPYLGSYITSRIGLLYLSQIASGPNPLVLWPKRALVAMSGCGDLSAALNDLKEICTERQQLVPGQLEIDFSREMLQRSLTTSKVQADIRRMQFLPDSSFELVECSSVNRIGLGTEEALREFSRILTPGGTLLLRLHGAAFHSDWELLLNSLGLRPIIPINSLLRFSDDFEKTLTSEQRLKLRSVITSTSWIIARRESECFDPGVLPVAKFCPFHASTNVRMRLNDLMRRLNSPLSTKRLLLASRTLGELVCESNTWSSIRVKHLQDCTERLLGYIFLDEELDGDKQSLKELAHQSLESINDDPKHALYRFLRNMLVVTTGLEDLYR